MQNSLSKKQLIPKLILFTIFLTPLLNFSLSFGFEQTKVLFFVFMVTILSVIWQYKLKENKLKFSKIKKISLVFLIMLTFTSVFGVSPINSLVGNPPYFQGLFVYFLLVIFFFLVSEYKVEFQKLSIIIVWPSFFVSIIALKEWILLNCFKADILNYSGRVISTFGQPNLYSGFLILSLPFIAGLIKNKSGFIKVLYVYLFVFISIGIFISQSRAAIILYFIFLFLWFSITNIFKKYSFIKFPTIIFVSITILLLTTVFLKSEVLNILSSTRLEGGAPEKRIFFWQVSKNIIFERFWLGYGLENINIAFPGYFNNLNFNTLNDPIAHSLKDISLDRFHNYLLDLLTFAGLPTALIWLYLFYQVFLKSNLITKQFLILYFLLVMVQNQSIVHLMYFWLVAGLSDQDNPQF